jgi:predicted HTH transcriptional regulator
MPDPKDVFDHPENHWDFLTANADVGFEGQYFDRKEAGRLENGNVSKTQLNSVVEGITECISAFSNSNKCGGLLVLGISKTGEVKGIDHLNDEQRGRITDINKLLKHQAAQSRYFDRTDEAGNGRTICLIYTPHTDYGICETLDATPKAWHRQGSQNILLNQQQREQLQREKRIVNFEGSYCCPYDPRDVDQGVLQAFREVALSAAAHNYSTEELLYEAGALIRDGNGYAFTKAGFLFFAANPQRVLSWSYIRLFRFDAHSEPYTNRGLQSFDKNFTGPITKQLRDLRAFFRESAFFKTYPRRNPDGGFTDEPEFPLIAVDEAIVNAVAHRDYAVQMPIECEHYRDALIVHNPGRLTQRDHDVPDHFSLNEKTLVSTWRNPKLIEWLRMMGDERGPAYIRAISEGTKRMSAEMSDMQLPPPLYHVGPSWTKVTLYNNATEREARLRAEAVTQSNEFTNLFPLTVTTATGQHLDVDDIRSQSREIMSALRDALVSQKWYIDRYSYSRIIAHQRGSDFQVSPEVANVVRFYPAYVFQLRYYWGHAYLCIDYTLEMKSVQSVRSLLATLESSTLLNVRAVVQWQGWQNGKIASVGDQWTRVQLFDFEQEVQVASHKVIPALPRHVIDRLLIGQGIQFDLYKAIKRFSLASEPNAARRRADYSQAVAEELYQTIFPLVVKGMHIGLHSEPAELSRQVDRDGKLRVESLAEPNVEFSRHHETSDIREGITKFGAYNHAAKTIELVPICTSEMRDNMAALIERLKTGKYKYRGAERTFSTRLTYGSIVTVSTPELVLDECKRLLQEHPEWIGNEQLNRIFLVHTPEQGYAIDNEQSPYYRIKRFLLEQGIPCQMVDTPTLHNPDWKDLNLALNVITKCGITPWVLPDAIPDADFFVGLSFTQNYRRGSERLMGYANVFNEYGRWEFYSGNTDTFDYAQRAEYFQTLIEDTLRRLNLSETPNIYFHYSAKFSKEDRDAILQAARRVRPQGTYSFVWINTQHNVRLYDSRPETDGSLSRGSYVATSPHQIYISTTGYNPYRKALGTPHMLEVNITTEYPDKTRNYRPDLRALAVQILSLTKLNWGSTDSLCAEPITIKYAGDIAYLTSAFLRQSGIFKLHPVLETTPWFL